MPDTLHKTWVREGEYYKASSRSLIGEWSNGLPHGHALFVREQLHRRPQVGDYFLVGEGGPLTQWGKAVGKGRFTAGKGLKVPNSIQEAADWCKTHLSPTTYDIFFKEK